MVDKLRKINNSLIDEKTNLKDIERQLLIKKIISRDDFIFNVDMEDAYSIFRDLGFKEEELKQIYRELISFKNYQN